jgi:hypothetical protein
MPQPYGRIMAGCIRVSVQVIIVCSPCLMFGQTTRQLNNVIANDTSLPKLMPDSIRKEFMQYVKTSFGDNQLRKLQRGIRLSETSGNVTNYVDGKMRGFGAAFNPLSGIPTRDHALNNSFSGASAEFMASDRNNTGPGNIAKAGIGDELSIMDIPFNIGGSYLTGQGVNYSNTLFKTSFNKEAYMNVLNKRISKYYDLDKYFLQDANVSGFAKNYLNAEFDKSIKSATGQLSSVVLNDVRSKLSPEEMMHLDMAQIEEKVLPAAKRSMLGDKITATETASSDPSLSAKQKDSLNTLAGNYKQELAGYQESINAIARVKKQMTASGFDVNKIINRQHTSESLVKQTMATPDMNKKIAENLLPLSGIQKLFLQMKTFNAGSFSPQGESGDMVNKVMNGVNFSSFNKNVFISGGAGSIKNGGRVKDNGLQTSLANPDQFLQTARIGKGDINGSHSHLMVVNSTTKNKSYNNYTSSVLPKNSFVGGFSKKMKMSNTSNVDVELMKSSTQYQNTYGNSNGVNEVVQRKSAIGAIGNDLFTTLSVRVNQSKEWQEIGLDHKIHVQYSGLGYSNPAATGNPKGQVRYGGSLRKKLDNGKASLGFSTDIRTFNLSADNSFKYNNATYQFDGKLRYSKNVRLGFKVNHSLMTTDQATVGKQKQFSSTKVTMESQASYNLFSKKNFTSLSVAHQSFTFSPLTGLKSNMIMTTLAQSLPLTGTTSISTVLFHNKELSGDAIIGDMFTTDVAFNYLLHKSIGLSSGVTYLDNASQAQQMGIKQSVSVPLLKYLDVSLLVDYRKDLRTQAVPGLYSNFSGFITANYTIK